MGVRVTLAPDTGQVSTLTAPSNSFELAHEEDWSKNASELDRDMTVGVELSDRSRCLMVEESTLSSEAMRALRTSGLRDAHISETDLGTSMPSLYEIIKASVRS